MAKLFFNQEIKISNLMGGGINDVDYEYCVGNNPNNPSIIAHQISESEYNNLINGTHHIIIENGSVVLRDEVGHPTDNTLPNVTFIESLISPTNPVECFNYYKKQLEFKKNQKPNHSQISKINDTLNHMNTIDTNTLTEAIEKVLLDVNKYVALEKI